MTGGPNRKLVRLVSESTFSHHGEAERWLPVVGWESSHAVSDLGRVRSLPRRAKGVKPGVMKPQNNGLDYLQVQLHCNKRTRTALVHVLVLEAFAGPCPPGQVSRHGPGGSLDNRLVNLCYGTQSENMHDMIRDGTAPNRHGERNPRARLTREIVAECRLRAAAGETHKSLAREFGVSKSAVGHAIRGYTWKVA